MATRIEVNRVGPSWASVKDFFVYCDNPECKNYVTKSSDHKSVLVKIVGNGFDAEEIAETHNCNEGA